MKTLLFVTITALVAAVLADTVQEKLHKYSDLCLSESGVSQESLNKVRNGEEADDPKLKDHAFCILKKTKFMNDKGEFLIENIKTKMNEVSDNADGIEKLVKKCAVQKNTPPESASYFIGCVMTSKKT